MFPFDDVIMFLLNTHIWVSWLDPTWCAIHPKNYILIFIYHCGLLVIIYVYTHTYTYTYTYTYSICIWVKSRNCGCLVTWFCYQLIAKPGNKTATVSWPDPYIPYPSWLLNISFMVISLALEQSLMHSVSGAALKDISKYITRICLEQILQLQQTNKTKQKHSSPFMAYHIPQSDIL